ncbi:hypothetical protein A3A75_00120 [Candidatus Woesebacteria bacterium RIFCSPLOWO2_01_FULL_39_10]|uniref:Glycosyltransferase 2-like domain-containing protein n=1 Tax=Candidatus Woesebacteria bacterium RIFCSPLOWO2_01_FULL_39_10 TaxID=1802516 RepID=A0A1F8BBS5_9BACT|nr:MAG: hypothetical protein A3A75_00120 [Candidatus Woesebacteria bacterium RIFCSPLOWO2_01_FULL_39_10]
MAVDPVRNNTSEINVETTKVGQISNGVDLSVIIPSRNEIFLNQTIKDILSQAVTNIEIIVAIDEKWPDEIVQDKKVTYLHPGVPMGMRHGINSCAAIARGTYLMKTDGHCLFAPGFDKVLIENHLEDNWVQIPRRYSLDGQNWKVDRHRRYRDYHFLCYPQKGKDPKDGDDGMHGVEWPQRTYERSDPKYDIDDTMGMQGSCWFMTKNHFDNFLHGLNEKDYGNIAQEGEEICNKTWLGGGAVKVNKKTWYAHLHKGKLYGRMYHLDIKSEVRGHNWSAEYWMNNRWPERVHNINWLINKFWPVPTWPEKWKELYYAGQKRIDSDLSQLGLLAYKYGSDKCPQLGHHHYTPVYYNLFKDKRETVKKVLEIGVGSPQNMLHLSHYIKGASLYMWRDFFPKAQIFGADILPELVFKDDRIETFQTDQSKKEDLDNLIAKTGTDIDLVVDDGSHNPKDQVLTCLTLMPKLKKEVIYVIEDVADTGIIDELKKKYNVFYEKFRHKYGWCDRLVIVTKSKSK